MILANHGIISSSGGSLPLLLDTYAGAAASYSLRKLRTAYSGNCIRVRRSSDNTSLNIGFTNNQLDTASLLSFVGSGSGYISTWYDQSGNSRDFTQSTLIRQPQIVNAGALIYEGSKISVKFDGFDHRMYTSSLTNWTSQGFSCYIVSRSGGLSGADSSIFSISNGTNNTNGYFFTDYRNVFPKSFRVYYSTDGDNGGLQNLNPINNFEGIQYLISTTRPATGNITFSLNNTTQSTTTANTLGTISGNFILGNFYTQNSDVVDYLHNGTISELIVYPNSQEANTSGINTNINTYYTIY